MQLLYKPDWEEAQARMLAWWAHEPLDRCCISVTAPRADAGGEPPLAPARPADRWLDFDYLAALNDYRLPNTFYGGEAFPIWSPGYAGWSSIPCFLGAPITLDESTGWVDPIIDHGSLTDHDYRSLRLDPQNRWWVLAHDLIRFGAEQARGRALPSLPAFGGCGDTLSALRSTWALLTDVVECPEYVREFDRYLMRQWMDVYDDFYDTVREASGGSTCWFALWSPGKFYSSHCDFAYMISPRMFSELFLPSIEMQTGFLDHTVHHVDGEGNFAHIDALLELPRLQALQILPGAGKPSPLHYMDVLKKVQAAGKNLHISIAANEVEAALQELSARGLFIATSCASEDEARSLLRRVAEWSRP